MTLLVGKKPTVGTDSDHSRSSNSNHSGSSGSRKPSTDSTCSAIASAMMSGSPKNSMDGTKLDHSRSSKGSRTNSVDSTSPLIATALGHHSTELKTTHLKTARKLVVFSDSVEPTQDELVKIRALETELNRIASYYKDALNCDIPDIKITYSNNHIRAEWEERKSVRITEEWATKGVFTKCSCGMVDGDVVQDHTTTLQAKETLAYLVARSISARVIASICESIEGQFVKNGTLESIFCLRDYLNPWEANKSCPSVSETTFVTKTLLELNTTYLDAVTLSKEMLAIQVSLAAIMTCMAIHHANLSEINWTILKNVERSIRSETATVEIKSETATERSINAIDISDKPTVTIEEFPKLVGNEETILEISKFSSFVFVRTLQNALSDALLHKGKIVCLLLKIWHTAACSMPVKGTMQHFAELTAKYGNELSQARKEVMLGFLIAQAWLEIGIDCEKSSKPTTMPSSVLPLNSTKIPEMTEKKAEAASKPLPAFPFDSLSLFEDRATIVKICEFSDSVFVHTLQNALGVLQLHKRKLVYQLLQIWQSAASTMPLNEDMEHFAELKTKYGYAIKQMQASPLIPQEWPEIGIDYEKSSQLTSKPSAMFPWDSPKVSAMVNEKWDKSVSKPSAMFPLDSLSKFEDEATIVKTREFSNSAFVHTLKYVLSVVLSHKLKLVGQLLQIWQSAACAMPLKAMPLNEAMEHFAELTAKYGHEINQAKEENVFGRWISLAWLEVGIDCGKSFQSTSKTSQVLALDSSKKSEMAKAMPLNEAMRHFAGLTVKNGNEISQVKEENVLGRLLTQAWLEVGIDCGKSFQSTSKTSQVLALDSPKMSETSSEVSPKPTPHLSQVFSFESQIISNQANAISPRPTSQPPHAFPVHSLSMSEMVSATGPKPTPRLTLDVNDILILQRYKLGLISSRDLKDENNQKVSMLGLRKVFVIESFNISRVCKMTDKIPALQVSFTDSIIKNIIKHCLEPSAEERSKWFDQTNLPSRREIFGHLQKTFYIIHYPLTTDTKSDLLKTNAKQKTSAKLDLLTTSAKSISGLESLQQLGITKFKKKFKSESLNEHSTVLRTIEMSDLELNEQQWNRECKTYQDAQCVFNKLADCIMHAFLTTLRTQEFQRKAIKLNY